MWHRVLITAVFLASFEYFMKLRDLLDWDKPFFYDHAPGPCVEVFKEGGAEDLTYIEDGGRGYILFSHGFGLDRGELMIMDLPTNSPTYSYQPLNISNPPTTPGFMASPHGISIWKDPNTGKIRVFVVTHPPSGDRIEIFDLISFTHLVHVRSVTDHTFRDLNDLVAVDKDKFYVTQWSFFRNVWGWYLEMALFRGSGEVLFYDGKWTRTVATGFLFTNGINISPDKSTVYVADFGYKRLVAFKRYPRNELVKIWEHNMNTAVDNIEVDQKTGDLWIGCHPVMYRIANSLRVMGMDLPTNVLKVKLIDNMVNEVIEVYADNDGSHVFGGSAATLVGNKLVIGTVFDQLVVCDAKHVH